MSKFKFKPKKDVDGSGNTNGRRAFRAETLIKGPDECDAYDLIADIFHLCDRQGWNVDEVVAEAMREWHEER